MPCAKDREELGRIIDSLAARFETPPFTPHATFCSGVWRREASCLTALVARLAAELPITMGVEEVDWTDHWATFFFLRLSGAEDLFSRVSGLVEGSHPPPVGSHLSLLYGPGASCIDRASLRQELVDCLPATIRFDRLAMVRPATGRWADVKSWEICYNTSSNG
jgi:hypothetical protein